MRRRRLIWAIGTKLAIGLTLSFPAGPRRDAVEYWAVGPLQGLEADAPVTLEGQPVGQVIAVSRRGDTTKLRLRFARGAKSLPGSRVVQLRRLGFPGVLALDIRVDTLPRAGPTRPFALGGLLHVAPSEPWPVEPPHRIRDTFPHPLPLWRPAPFAPRPVALIRT